MTIKVTITHSEPNYPKSIVVQNVGTNGATNKTILGPGESTTLYVYQNQDIMVYEAPVDNG
jgi:hypothetical protein